MGFHELIAQGRDPGENGLPETYYDDLIAEYSRLEHGSQELSEGFRAKETDYQSQLSARDAELHRLKMQNYDLLMSSAGDEGNQKDTSTEETPQGIDSLFDRT